MRLETKAGILERAARFVTAKAHVGERVDQLKHMLFHKTTEELEFYNEEDIGVCFAGLIKQTDALLFELDSDSTTLKKHIGVLESQDKKTDELAGTRHVPPYVHTFFSYLAARKIQNQRKLLFDEHRPGKSTSHWKFQMRDDIRRRIWSYRKGLTDPVDESVEQSDPGPSDGAQKPEKLSKNMKRKMRIEASGGSYNREQQERKRANKVKGTSSKAPDPTPCAKANDLIKQFEAIAQEFVKYENAPGGLIQYVADHGKEALVMKKAFSAWSRSVKLNTRPDFSLKDHYLVLRLMILWMLSRNLQVRLLRQPSLVRRSQSFHIPIGKTLTRILTRPRNCGMMR